MRVAKSLVSYGVGIAIGVGIAVLIIRALIALSLWPSGPTVGYPFAVEVVDAVTGEPLPCGEIHTYEAVDPEGVYDFTGVERTFGADSNGIVQGFLKPGNYGVNVDCSTGGYPVLADGSVLQVSSSGAKMFPGRSDYFEKVDDRIRVRLLPRSYWPALPDCPGGCT